MEKIFFLKIRLFFKKFPLAVKIKKIIFYFNWQSIHINFLNRIIINNKKKVFDNFKKNVELLAINNYNEKYIVNTSDTAIGRSLYINGNFEFDNFLHTLKILDKNSIKTLIDIGANIGSICIPAIKRGFLNNCIAIEPDPYNFDLLRKNIFINNINNKIQTFNFGLGQINNKKKKFELSENNFGDHRIKSNYAEKNLYNEDSRKIISIKIKKLDTIIKKFNPKKTLIWIDVQGYEAFVLEGGINTLSKKPPLVIEFWPYGLDKFNSYNLFKKNIINVGYKNCYDLESKYYLKDLNGHKLDDLYFELKSCISYTNLLFFN